MKKNIPIKSSEIGTKEGWARITYIVKKDTAQRVKNYAYWARLDIKEVVETALSNFLKGKNTRPIPNKK